MGSMSVIITHFCSNVRYHLNRHLHDQTQCWERNKAWYRGRKLVVGRKLHADSQDCAAAIARAGGSIADGHWQAGA